MEKKIKTNILYLIKVKVYLSEISCKGMAHQHQHALVYLFTMEGCGHCESLKEGNPSAIEQLESICSRGCQIYKHFHLINGTLTPSPKSEKEISIAAKVTGYPTLVTTLGDKMDFQSGGDKVVKFVQAFARPLRSRRRRGTPFADGSSSSSLFSLSSLKKHRRGSSSV
jgi:hypothetical protein